MRKLIFALISILVCIFGFGCGGGGGEVGDIITDVPDELFTGVLGANELNGAWHLEMLTASGGGLRSLYFIAQEYSTTNAIGFFSGPWKMTWVQISHSGTAYTFQLYEYDPQKDFQSHYTFNGTRTGNVVNGNFNGEAEDAFHSTNAGHFSGTFKAEIIPSASADFLAPAEGGQLSLTGKVNGAIGDGLGDIEINGTMIFQVSSYEVEGTLTFDILDNYGAPIGNKLQNIPISGTLTGLNHHEFKCTFDFAQGGWTGSGEITGLMASIGDGAGWLYDFISNGKVLMEDVNGYGHQNWNFRCGWWAKF